MRAFWTFLLIACGAPASAPAAPIDHDGDAIVGDADRCPHEAEDLDGFQDADGCLDADNDADQIDDVDDQCVDDAEDLDGFQDEDGCPEPDNDEDRILDVDDACPCHPETYNGVDDEDGCPDCGRVLMIENRIDVEVKVYFAAGSSEILPVNIQVLDAVATVLAEYDSIRLVAIQGHAARGERRPARLAEERAERVVAELIARGVASERLVAESFARDQPILPGRSAEAREANRRVEFELREYDPPPPPDCAPGEPVAGCGS